MGRDSIDFLKELFLMVNGANNKKSEVCFDCLMVMYSKVISEIMRGKWGNMCIKMEMYMRANGKMMLSMVMENWQCPTVNLMKVISSKA